MLLKKIEIKNFKSFKHQEIYDLSHINMIYGYNNSGKSNLLKFIEIIFRRKLSESQTSTVPGTDESFTEETYGGWWEGLIEAEPYIFRNGDRTKDIKFSITIAARKDRIQESIDFYEDLKEKYFSDKDVKSAKEKVEELEKKIQKLEEEGDKDEELPELKTDAGKARDRLSALKEANKDEGTNVELEISGRLISRGRYDSEMKLDSVKIFDRFIFRTEDTSEKYFEEIEEEISELEDPYAKFNDILSLFDDAVLFLDNDRYFTSEKVDKNIDSPSPKTFKNWLYNLYLNPYSFKEYNDIISQVEKFDPSSDGDAIITAMERNSPLKPIELNFGRTPNDELLLLLGNQIDSVDRLPLESYGTGIQQIFYILARISEFRPKIILLEELELNLSPKYQEKLVQHILLNLIKKDDYDVNQLFFTTHSPLLSIHHEYQIHQVTINEEGETKFNKVNKEDISSFYPQEVIDEIINQHGNH